MFILHSSFLEFARINGFIPAQHNLNVRFCVAFNISYATLLSHNYLYGWPRVVSAPMQRFIALSVQLCGDYAAHRGALYLRAAYQWLQL